MDGSPDWFPVVTVQLPVYNEKYVVKRAIDSLTRLDWPRDRLQIQVLDDSTDETTILAQRCVESYCQQGLNIVLVHREQRDGFKAGALNAAMTGAIGEFIVIFDADFRPESGFLHDTIPYLADPELGFVQTRWGHLNDDFSLLAQAQAMALDGHFVVEHVARQRAGLLTNFSGTGGVWRRVCIETCGGWRPKMLTEDIDLSYRAQLAGWKGLILPNVVTPAELPVQLAAFKQQQFRWAKGNTQCLLKQSWSLLQARLSLLARIQGLIHLSYYLAHPLMLLVMLFTLPLIWFGWLDRWSLAFLSLATLGPPMLYAIGQRAIYSDWKRRLRALPVLIALGTGMALNSTVAIIEAILGIETAFLRTPKFQVRDRHMRWEGMAYALKADRLVLGEGLLTVYALLTVLAAAIKGYVQVIPFVMLYAAGFGYVSLLAVLQDRRQVVACKREHQEEPQVY
ncbi:MAG: glycosyltransferase [Anaerolineae bacterium]|nr:glycosyltransferase [Anaerolineae bacterium]